MARKLHADLAHNKGLRNLKLMCENHQPRALSSMYFFDRLLAHLLDPRVLRVHNEFAVRAAHNVPIDQLRLLSPGGTVLRGLRLLSGRGAYRDAPFTYTIMIYTVGRQTPRYDFLPSNLDKPS